MQTPTSTSDDTLLEGRYRLLYPLGEGGSATVFEALDEKLGQRVAIKLLSDHDEGQREAWRARFDAEVLLTARQQHPNIVRVMDAGTSAQGSPFLVMELLLGHTLAHELWQHGPLERARALRLLKRLLHALDSLHTAGIVHRDLKPSNLFITSPRSEAEDIKLLDLGIAFDFTASGGRHTKQDERVGTPAYMAPEYEVYDMISPAGDVYQAALIALELLTASPATSNAASIATRLEALGQDDAALATVLSCALADDPDERYPVASALLDALKRAEQPDVSATLSPVSVDTPQQPAHRRYRWHIGVAAVGLALSAALLFNLRAQTETPPTTAPPAQSTTNAAIRLEEKPPLLDSTAPAKPPTQQEISHKPTPTMTAKPALDSAPMATPRQRTPKKRPSTTQAQPKIEDNAKDPLKEQLKQELRWMEHGEH